jgi:hypothetical protein
MWPLVDEAAIADQDHFIDAIGELITSVLDMHLRRGMGNIAAIHIGVSRHALFP